MGGETEICRAQNEVARTCDPSRHAEIAAIAEAGRRLGRRDLSGAHADLVLPTLRDVSGRDALGRHRPADLCRPPRKSRTRFFPVRALNIADLQRASGGAFAYLGGVDEARVLPVYRPNESGGTA